MTMKHTVIFCGVPGLHYFRIKLVCVSINRCIQGKTKGSGYNTLKYTIQVPKINKIVY